VLRATRLQSFFIEPPEEKFERLYDSGQRLQAHSVWRKQHGQLKTRRKRFSASHYRLPATFRNTIRTRAGAELPVRFALDR
jgi:hypothetical protein